MANGLDVVAVRVENKSAVVVWVIIGTQLWPTELTASATDNSQRKAYEELFRGYQKEKLLIVPNEDDWLMASKVLYLLTQNRRRSGAGKLRRLDKGLSQRMALDALIAASARRCNLGVVTENWKDFKLIQRFCNVKIFKAAEFFR